MPSAALDGLTARFADEVLEHRMDAMAQVELATSGGALWLDPKPAPLAPLEVL